MIYEDFENMPLPEHTKLNFYECLAKIVLEELFGDVFVDLEVKDKPDLQNSKIKIGVEVTRAINPIQERNEKLFNKIEYGMIRNKKKAIEVINDSYKPCSVMINGEEIREPERYSKGMLMGIPENDSFDRICESFKEKIYKLNSGLYTMFLHNYLFVYSEILANQKMIDEVIIKMNIFQEDYNRKFEKIFVYVPYYLYILNLVDKIGEIKNIKKYQYDWGMCARNMIIQHEIE